MPDRAFDRTYRDGSSFSYTLAVPTERPSKLLITYWDGEKEERRFSIFVNDRKVASQKLLNNKPDAGGQKVNPVTVPFERSQRAWPAASLTFGP